MQNNSYSIGNYIKQLPHPYEKIKLFETHFKQIIQEEKTNNLVLDNITFSLRVKKPNNTYINLTYLEEKQLNDIIKKYNVSIYISHYWLKISICPPKFLYDTQNNLIGVTYQELIECLNKLDSVIEEIENTLHFTVETNILDANLARIDLTRNIIIDESFHTYIPGFEEIKAKQNLEFKKTMGIMETTYSTLYFQSKQRTRGNRCIDIKIYDKKMELNKKNIIVPELKDKNIMRFEVSLNGSKTIQNKLKIKTVKDLLDKGFDYLDEKRASILKEYLFYEHLDTDTPCLNSLEDIELARNIRAKEGRNGLINYMLVKNLISPNYKYELETLTKAGFKKDHIERTFKKLKQTRRVYKSPKENVNSTLILYKEIYNKLFKTNSITETTKNSA